MRLPTIALLLVATDAALRIPRRVALAGLGAGSIFSPLTPPSSAASVSSRVATPFKINADTSFVQEAEAQFALARHYRADVETSYGSVSTSFCRAGKGNAGPKLLFMHGADASFFEWRYMLSRLSDAYDCTAIDWWGGGWTDRRPIYDRSVQQPTPPQPWPDIAEHIRCFAEQQLGSQPIVLVGASLGGAAAIDVAARYPDLVKGLILVDAGGESYASPSPDIVTACAPLASSIQLLINKASFLDATYSKEARLLALHRNEPLWLEAGGEYLRSGSYERVVKPERIRGVTQRTLVLWGADDPVLNVRDAAKFGKDLRNAEVHVVPAAGHSPQLDQPAAVAGYMRQFVKELA